MQFAGPNGRVPELPLWTGRERVLYGPNQTEHFQRVSLESVHLKTTCVSHCACSGGSVFVWLHLNPVHGRGNPAGTIFQHEFNEVWQLQFPTHLPPNAVSCIVLLATYKSWDIEQPRPG